MILAQKYWNTLLLNTLLSYDIITLYSDWLTHTHILPSHLSEIIQAETKLHNAIP